MEAEICEWASVEGGPRGVATGDPVQVFFLKHHFHQHRHHLHHRRSPQLRCHLLVGILAEEGLRHQNDSRNRQSLKIIMILMMMVIYYDNDDDDDDDATWE